MRSDGVKIGPRQSGPRQSENDRLVETPGPLYLKLHRQSPLAWRQTAAMGSSYSFINFEGWGKVTVLLTDMRSIRDGKTMSAW